MQPRRPSLTLALAMLKEGGEARFAAIIKVAGNC